MTQTLADQLLKPEVLKRLDLLSALSEEALLALVPRMRIARFAKRAVVVSKGSTSDALLFLITGKLQVVDYTEDGKEIGLNFLSPGSYFGELALIDGLPRSATIIAIEQSVVALLPGDVALKLIYGNPKLAEQMLNHFASSIRNLTEFRCLLAIPNTHQRLYALLCQIKRTNRDGKEVIVDLPTQKRLAIMINTSRETVSRALAELELKGILQKGGRRVLIIENRHALEALAGGGSWK